jgi:hypothetical protein
MSTRPDASGLPQEVSDLLVRHVESMEQTEVLLALARAGTPRRADDIASEVRIDAAAAVAALELFVQRGLVAHDKAAGTYQYAPSTPALARSVTALMLAYDTRPVTLIKALYARPSAVQSFADAFRLRKPGE